MPQFAKSFLDDAMDNALLLPLDVRSHADTLRPLRLSRRLIKFDLHAPIDFRQLLAFLLSQTLAGLAEAIGLESAFDVGSPRAIGVLTCPLLREVQQVA